MDNLFGIKIRMIFKSAPNFNGYVELCGKRKTCKNQRLYRYKLYMRIKKKSMNNTAKFGITFIQSKYWSGTYLVLLLLLLSH